MYNLPDKSGDNGLDTEDYHKIQRYIAKPLIYSGLMLITLDGIGYYLKLIHIYVIPELDPHNFIHLQVFLIGLTIMGLTKIFIYLDIHTPYQE